MVDEYDFTNLCSSALYVKQNKKRQMWKKLTQMSKGSLPEQKVQYGENTKQKTLHASFSFFPGLRAVLATSN